MARFSLDTNILIYSIDPTDAAKHRRASHLIERVASNDNILTQQVLGEFLNAGRKFPAAQSDIRDAADTYDHVFTVRPTPLGSLLPAFDRAVRFKLQFWDALIIEACLAHGVTHLFSEDFQDRQRFESLTVINPFVEANGDMLEQLLIKEDD